MTIGARRVLQGAAVLLLLSSFVSSPTMRAAIDEQRLPLPQGLVSDFARKLSPATKQQIEPLLLNFRNRTGIEVAVVMIPFDDMQGYPIEEYALRLGRRWGVGSDAQKRALLLLVAIKPPDAHGVYSGGTRLEVSRHLEGDIPDILAAELIRKMRNGFVAGRFDEALTTGTQMILATLAERLAVSMVGIDPSQAVRQPVPQPVSQPSRAPTRSQAEKSGSDFIILIVSVSLLGLAIYAIWGRGIAEAPWGSDTDFSNVGRRRNRRRRRRSSATGAGSGWSGGGGGFSGFSGGGGGGWSGGGGGGFGGFSGGGGDFGGGGASSSW